jgi:ribonuclease Z
MKARLRLVALVGTALLLGACERFMDRQVEKNLSRAETGLLSSPDMTVVLCGTGSPLAAPDRASACTAVIAGGQLILVDVGPGSWKTVDLQNLPTAAVGTILLTHLHSDHIGDLGEATTQSWIAGRTTPLDIYGPTGTERVVAGFQQAYAPDTGYRVKHHGEAALPPDGARAVAHEIALPSDPLGAVTVFEKNGLKVSAFRVDHQPVEPALGYRFDYGGRLVVVSGDTKKSASLQHNAEGVDLLVHEALQPELIQRAARVAKETGRTRLAKLASDIPTYHTSPVEAAEIARDAHVKHLVFTHLVPAPTNFLVRRAFLSGVSNVYTGEVTLGADGMRFTLAPAS